MRTDTFNNSQYVCADERKCVPVNRICNKRNDCSDGSDEKQGCKFDSPSTIPTQQVLKTMLWGQLCFISSSSDDSIFIT